MRLGQTSEALPNSRRRCVCDRMTQTPRKIFASRRGTQGGFTALLNRNLFAVWRCIALSPRFVIPGATEGTQFKSHNEMSRLARHDNEVALGVNRQRPSIKPKSRSMRGRARNPRLNSLPAPAPAVITGRQRSARPTALNPCSTTHLNGAALRRVD